MNILYICDEYPPGKNGGIGTMVQVLGRELVKQGHSVYVAGLYAYRYGSSDYEEDWGVKVYRLRYGLNLRLNEKNRLYNLLEKLPNGLKRNLNGKRAFIKYLEFIEQLIEKENIDVIEIQDWNNFSFFIGFSVEWPTFKIPLIVKSNGSYTYFANESNTKTKKYFHLIDLKLYARADALSAVSQYTANKNKQLFNISKDVKVLYNSIEIPDIKLDNEKHKQKIIITGTLVIKKGIFQLMKAWNFVNEKFPNAELVIYGKGKIKRLKQLLNEKSSETVFFKGHVSRNELFQELSNATMAIFPSYSECFALAPLEALVVGCPIINTSRSSGKELVTDKENGSLINPDNVEEIANKIIELIENQDLQKKYSIKGREKVIAEFNIVNSAKDHINYYNEVINSFKLKNH